MNTDETQMKAGTDYLLRPVTEQLIGAAFEVHNALGYGFLERVYQRAMQVELQSRGVKVELEPQIRAIKVIL
jgi:GxxExxY protein